MRVRLCFSLRASVGHKVAKFRQVDTDRPNVHHDALEFPDGKTVLLTQLCEGQRATVLQLPPFRVSPRTKYGSTTCSRSNGDRRYLGRPQSDRSLDLLRVVIA